MEKRSTFIQKIDHYIAKYEFPTEPVPAPERSYELVGDEKWITEKGGKELLEQLGIYEKLNIIPVSDPLMFAMNPNQLTNSTQLHLIVENKTTYQGLLPELTSAMFSTLIYGSGKKIVKSIEQFQAQYPIEADHHFLYFGDIDREGIAIWHSLNKRTEAHPALPFYRACLAKTPASGKEYQREQQEATVHFLSHFRTQEQTNIKNLLNEGNYLPQETLKTKELQQIWRETDWTEWI
ncbi:MAG: DUF2220 domain-containing protein [Bacillus sp. (in: Bacteria)]|nr:DUF2220 domain-containing protein [Bacillus sp. (in: firmicutes)]